MIAVSGVPKPTEVSTTVPATATGLLSLLSEPSLPLKHFALTRLLAVVDTLWHEIAHALPDLEALSEGVPSSSSSAEEESSRHLAAAVASRVFFHLEEPFQALRLAMESGEEYFHSLLSSTVRGKDAYVDSLIGAAIEAFIAVARHAEMKRNQQLINTASSTSTSSTSTGGDVDMRMTMTTMTDTPMPMPMPMLPTTTTTAKLLLPPNKGGRVDPGLLKSLDPIKLQRLVQVMFQRCFEDENYKQAIGIAMEAREINLLCTILMEAQKRSLASMDHASSSSLYNLYQVLSYAMDMMTDDHLSTMFRQAVLDLVAQHFKALFDSQPLSTLDSSSSSSSSCTMENTVVGKQVLTYPTLSSYSTGMNRTQFANIRMKCIFRFVQIQQRLKRYTTVAMILNRLLYGDTMDSVTSNTVKEEEKDVLLAFQIAFHIVDSGDQYYVEKKSIKSLKL